MKRYRFLLIFLTLSFLIFSCKEQDERKYSVVKGVYDAVRLEDDEIVDLEGEWIFVPSHFVSPTEDFSKFKRYELINLGWDKYTVPEESLGYATYAVRIEGLSPDKIYGIKTCECLSAFTAYVNGEEFFRFGQAGRSKEEEIPALDASIMLLPLHGARNAVLVFHVSNFSSKFMGFPKPIEFGLYTTIKAEKNNDTIVLTVIAALLLMLGTFFTSLYFFYSREKLSLYFGLICVNFAIRVCCYDEFLIVTILPFLNYAAIFKIGYITLTLAILFVSLFIQKLFQMTKRIVLLIFFIPCFMYLGVNIFATPYISSSLLIYAQIYVLFLGIYNVILACIKAVKKNRAAYLFLFGLLIFLYMAIRDVLVANRLIEGKFIAHFGPIALLIPMSIIVLRSFKISSDRYEAATKNLEEINSALSRFLPNEFTQMLGINHVDIKLGDNAIRELYIVFMHIDICKDIGEETKREKALEIYNKALSYINPIIEYHNGFVDKYLPDGLMVLFDERAEDVIKCLLQISLLVQRENIERVLNGEDELLFSSGIHYGPLMIGTIGKEERMDGTVISDAVNIASRLNSYALKQNIPIVISQIVKDNFEDDINDCEAKFQYKGRVQLKGKIEAMEIYEVIRG